MTTKVDTPQLLKQARMLVERLERISADSVWAHRSSGQRGSLWQLIDYLENPSPSKSKKEIDQQQIIETINKAFKLLERAGREKIR